MNYFNQTLNHEVTKSQRNTKCERVTILFSSSWLRAFVVQHSSARLAVVLLLSLLADPTVASAHAFLDHAEPRVGSEVDKSPDQVKLWFTQQPEHAFSKIQVFNADGKQVDKSDTRTDPDDSKVLMVSLPPLRPGTYKVVWHVLSVDTHRTEGSFKFSLK